MTLEELARKLREILEFKYVTVANYKHEGPVTLDCWEYKPTFYDEDCTWRGFHHRGGGMKDCKTCEFFRGRVEKKHFSSISSF